MNRVMMHESVSKMIGDKRPTFKQLITRNYELPKHPLYTGAAGLMHLLNLFGI
jgi:hypothetical protein